jgi:hypothetical protein
MPAAALVFLALAGGATAALEVRLSVIPARPRTGQRVSVMLRPYRPYLRADGSCCDLEPANVDYPFKIEASSPSGRVFRIRVARKADPYVWTGSFSFRSPGRWEVRATNWGPRYSESAGGRPRIIVRVRSRA